MYNKICFGLLILIGILNFDLITGSNNLAKTKELHESIKQQQQVLTKIQQDNANLLATIKVLKDYPLSIEERARLDLGLVKPNEQFYHVVTIGD